MLRLNLLKDLNPLNQLKVLDKVGQIKDTIGQTKLAIFILVGVMAAILIALIVLILKKRK